MITLTKLRAAAGVPSIEIEACEICKHIPRHCSQFVKGGDVQHDNIPQQVERLVSFLAAPDVRRCPICSRLYRYETEYEFLVGGSEDTYEYTRVTHEELLHEKRFMDLRVDSDELCGMLGRPRRKAWYEVPQYFRGHCVAAVEVGDDKAMIHIALPDDAPALVLTVENVARIVASAPVEPLDDQERVLKYAADVDKWTSEYRYGFLRVARFDEIPWRKELTGDDRMQIEDLRRASRVRPLHVEQLVDRWELRYWVVAEQKLICRVLTVRRSGEIEREDAIVGEAIPTHLGKRWQWDHATKRSIPVG